MKKVSLFLLIALLISSCSSGIRSIAEGRSESAIKEWIKEHAAKKSYMPLLDFNLQKIGIVIDNDSICSILFDLSVTTSKNGTETNPISFTIVKDMAMSKLDGEDVFKELVDYKKSFVITEENIKRDIDFYTNTSINPSPKQAEQFVYNNIYERVLENGNLMP